MGIHQWPLDTPDEQPVMQKAFSYHNVPTIYNIRLLHLSFAVMVVVCLRWQGRMKNRKGCHYWCAILIAHQIVMAKHGGSCVHFSGMSTCGRTSRETVSHPQCPPFPTLCKISLPIYVIVTNKLLQPLTTIWYDSLVLSFAFLKIYRRLIKHRSFLCVLRPVLRSWQLVEHI